MGDVIPSTPKGDTAAWAAKTREKYALLIEPLRAAAREHGYALTVHGSLARDIDLVAVPWTGTPSEPVVLAQAIQAKAAEVSGAAFMKPEEVASHARYFEAGMPGNKPHGRLVWSFHLGGGPYIDLSVMPPAPTATDEALRRFMTAEEAPSALCDGTHSPAQILDARHEPGRLLHRQEQTGWEPPPYAGSEGRTPEAGVPEVGRTH